MARGLAQSTSPQDIVLVVRPKCVFKQKWSPHHLDGVSIISKRGSTQSKHILSPQSTSLPDFVLESQGLRVSLLAALPLPSCFLTCFLFIIFLNYKIIISYLKNHNSNFIISLFGGFTRSSFSNITH